MNSFDRAARWNSRRYEREFILTLFGDLIKEEYQEYLDAETEVDKLDALCDIAFICSGGIWKTRAHSVVIKESFDTAYESCLIHVNCLLHPPIYCVIGIIDAMLADELDVMQGIALIVSYTTIEASAMGIGANVFEQALLVVCDSNDSKTIAKTESHIKANISKGDFFVAPEPRLQEILDART